MLELFEEIKQENKGICSKRTFSIFQLIFVPSWALIDVKWLCTVQGRSILQHVSGNRNANFFLDAGEFKCKPYVKTHFSSSDHFIARKSVFPTHDWRFFSEKRVRTCRGKFSCEDFRVSEFKSANRSESPHFRWKRNPLGVAPSY